MRWRLVLLVMVLCAVALPGAPALGAATCDTTVATPGGDWRHFGGDVSSTRHQTAEDAIGPDTVGDLEVAWTYGNGAGGGYITSTVVAGNCVFFTDEPAFGSNYVYA